MSLRLALAVPAVVMSAGPALAHHPMGGAVPADFLDGVLSGLGHPILGIDHLAFVVAVGLAAAFVRGAALVPLAAVAAACGGCLLTVADMPLPAVEPVIAGSVILLGGVAMFGRQWPILPGAAVFAIAGLFHGWAYGEAVVGAETTPIIAYLIGLAAIQYAVALGVMGTVRWIWRASSPVAVQPRLAGAVCTGIGLVFMFDIVEGALFP